MARRRAMFGDMGLPPHIVHFPSGVHDSVIHGVTFLVPDSVPDGVAIIFGDELPELMPEPSPELGLRELLHQCGRACEEGLYYAALMTALTVPSICGALGAEKGTCSGSTYRAWLVAAMGYDSDTARRIYALRCSLLHEGSAHPHKEKIPMAFVEPVEPGTPQLHLVRTDVRGATVEWLSISLFIDQLNDAVGRWLDQYGSTTTVERNFRKFAHRRPQGLAPHVLGTPVIG